MSTVEEALLRPTMTEEQWFRRFALLDHEWRSHRSSCWRIVRRGGPELEPSTWWFSWGQRAIDTFCSLSIGPGCWALLISPSGERWGWQDDTVIIPAFGYVNGLALSEGT